VIKILILFFLFGNITYANNVAIADVCKELKLVPASKAIVQWERVFSSEKRKKKYGIDLLSPETQVLLKTYLIQHAADSSQPMVPGL
jgi:hypothetical protein